MHQVRFCHYCGKITHVFLAVCNRGHLCEWWLCRAHNEYWEGGVSDPVSILSTCQRDDNGFTCPEDVALYVSRALDGTESVPEEVRLA